MQPLDFSCHDRGPGCLRFRGEQVTSVLRLENITKSFSDERGTRQLVLSGVSLNVQAGEIVWLRGESGSGKSTILNISGLLSTPDAGKVWINGNDRTDASSRTASRVRSS